jgi:hypothetical protein
VDLTAVEELTSSVELSLDPPIEDSRRADASMKRAL